MAAFYASCAISLVVFLVCFPLVRAHDIVALPNNTAATQLLLQDQAGENLFSSYRSVLVNQLNRSTHQNGGLSITAQCWAGLIKIESNPAELFKCKSW